MTHPDGAVPKDEQCTAEGDHECQHRGTPDCRRKGGRGRGDGSCRRENKNNGTVGMTASSPIGGAIPTFTSVAVCAEGPALSDRVHERFGRAGCFQLIDLETMASVVISNDENRAGAEGAGIGAVELLAHHGAQAAIVTKVGPKAADAFRRAAIPVYTAAGLTVREAVTAFSRGELTRLDLG